MVRPSPRHHTVDPGSVRYGERLAKLGAVPSIGSVDDSHDVNAFAESLTAPDCDQPRPHLPPWLPTRPTGGTTVNQVAPRRQLTRCFGLRFSGLAAGETQAAPSRRNRRLPGRSRERVASSTTP